MSLDRDAAATAQQRPPALETILGLPSGELAAQPNQLRICLVTPMSTDGLTLRISLVGSLLLTSTRSPRASMSPSPHRLRRRRWYTPLHSTQPTCVWRTCCKRAWRCRHLRRVGSYARRRAQGRPGRPRLGRVGPPGPTRVRYSESDIESEEESVEESDEAGSDED